MASGLPHPYTVNSSFCYEVKKRGKQGRSENLACLILPFGFDFRFLYVGVFLSSGPLILSSPVGPALIETRCSSALQNPTHSLYPGKQRRQFFHYNKKNKTENADLIAPV